MPDQLAPIRKTSPRCSARSTTLSKSQAELAKKVAERNRRPATTIVKRSEIAD
jgi:hypothetical protein